MGGKGAQDCKAFRILNCGTEACPKRGGLAGVTALPAEACLGERRA